MRGHYYVEVTVRLMLDVYAEDTEEARRVAHRIAKGIVDKAGLPGRSAVIGIQARRVGSAKGEHMPRKEIR